MIGKTVVALMFAFICFVDCCLIISKRDTTEGENDE